MAENQNIPRPRNLFELINQNVVDLSQDVVKLYQLVAEMHIHLQDIHAALYPQQEESEPNADGADTINE